MIVISGSCYYMEFNFSICSFQSFTSGSGASIFMQQREIVNMKSMAGIRTPSGVMDVPGSESEISMLQSIPIVKGVLLVEFWFRWRRYITNFRWLKVAHMIAVI